MHSSLWSSQRITKLILFRSLWYWIIMIFIICRLFVYLYYPFQMRIVIHLKCLSLPALHLALIIICDSIISTNRRHYCWTYTTIYCIITSTRRMWSNTSINGITQRFKIFQIFFFDIQLFTRVSLACIEPCMGYCMFYHHFRTRDPLLPGTSTHIFPDRILVHH